MSITVGRKNPQIIGGIDSINKPNGGAVVNPLEQGEGLKNIDEVGAEASQEAVEAPQEEEQPKKRRTRKTKK